MKLREKITDRWTNKKVYVGKKNKYNVTVSYAPTDFTGKKDYWYFLIVKEDIDYSYNSLWDKLKYTSKEECIEACEKKIEELIKSK